jgi:hypothetical protein
MIVLMLHQHRTRATAWAGEPRAQSLGHRPRPAEQRRLSLLDTRRKAARCLPSLWEKGDVYRRQSCMERGLSVDGLLPPSDRLSLRRADGRLHEVETSGRPSHAPVRGPQVTSPILSVITTV